MNDINNIVAQLLNDPIKKAELTSLVQTSGVFDKPFIPNIGPQTAAYFSKADILLYGGEPSGGKTGLLCGLALNEHRRSLIVRKKFKDAEGIVDNLKEMLGTEQGFVGGNSPKYKMGGGRVIHFEGLEKGAAGSIDTSKQGVARDFIGVDEAAQLPKDAVMMLLGWNRPLGDYKEQRCRMVLASNPPVDTVGDWLGEFFAPWLDEKHINPAANGELRWYVINDDGESIPVEGEGIHEVDGKQLKALSRTFIRANVKDNPYIDEASYMSRIQAMPEPARSIFLSGNFLHARKDMEWQLIPTEWVKLAQKRWEEHGKPNGAPMCAMGIDCARGGDDMMVMASRYDGWYDHLIKYRGSEVPDGQTAAAMISKHRRDGALLIIDTNGVGCSPFDQLRTNGVEPVSYNAARAAMKRSKDKTMKFYNKRAQDYWIFMEALDPNQHGGSAIMLPPDRELLSDLTSVCIKNPSHMMSQGVLLESKEDIKKRIHRSTDCGDAVVMAYSEGLKQENIAGGWQAYKTNRQNAVPRVNMGRDSMRRK
jgi:hypothetical protein